MVGASIQKQLEFGHLFFRGKKITPCGLIIQHALLDFWESEWPHVYFVY